MEHPGDILIEISETFPEVSVGRAAVVRISTSAAEVGFIGVCSDHAADPLDGRKIGLKNSHSAENRGRATIPPSLFDSGIERDAGRVVNREIR